MRFKLTYKHLLFGSILAMLSLFRVQEYFHLFPETPLNGTPEQLSPKPYLCTEYWFDGSYQEEYDAYYTKQFGCRNDFVRLNCQIAYSVFSTAKAGGIIKGKDGYLLDEKYIRAATGEDFVGYMKLKMDLEKVRKVQDTLRKLHKELVFVFVPGKASFFYDKIPSKRARKKPFNTNHAVYVNAFKKNRIPLIDFKTYFEANKVTSKYPLFAKCGIHWSTYSSYLATDSMNTFFHHLRNTKGSSIQLVKINMSEQNSDEDYDIGRGLNLLFPLDTYPMAYPETRILNKGAKCNPKVLFIADSYFWNIYTRNFSADLFGNGEFWYYNKQIYPDTYSVETLVQNAPIKERVEKHDIITILSTDANLENFSFGFIDQMYHIYFPNN